MKALFLALFLLIQPPGTGFLHATVEHDGLERSVWMYIPESYDPEVPMPLVIVLHPAGGGAQGMAAVSGINGYAEEYGFIALYPEGYYGYYDYGAEYPSWANAPDLVNDPAFMRYLFEEIQQELNIDPEQIYAVGYSNGARMAFWVGCNLPVAGIAAVSASISDEVTTYCQPEMQPRVLYMHGTADDVTPWAGKRLHIENMFISNALSAPDTAAFWAEHNGCAVEPSLENLETERWTITIQTHDNCENEVAFYGIERGGHQWFRDDTFDASATIMEFFFAEE